tara:strand:- start:77 stop:256 length:180 start_codon:yes stop_codon:yes gene_type:complete
VVAVVEVGLVLDLQEDQVVVALEALVQDNQEQMVQQIPVVVEAVVVVLHQEAVLAVVEL